MTIVKSQDLCTSIPLSRIIRTTVERKAEDLWIITATLKNDRPVTLARFPSQKEAIVADMFMWLSSEPIYYFPILHRDDVSGKEVPHERTSPAPCPESGPAETGPEESGRGQSV